MCRSIRDCSAVARAVHVQIVPNTANNIRALLVVAGIHDALDSFSRDARRLRLRFPSFPDRQAMAIGLRSPKSVVRVLSRA